MNNKYFDGYKQNQYEEYYDGKFVYGEEVMARYIKQIEPTYMGNLLIEALPPINTFEQICNQADIRPIYSKKERQLPTEYRLHGIYRLCEYRFPLSSYIETERKLSIVIRRGYVPRNIASPEYIRRLRHTSKLLSEDWRINDYKEALLLCQNNASSSPGFPVLGISDVGKSKGVETILDYYPQNIKHIGFPGNEFLFRQLSWLKIDCAHNGSLKGLCQKYFNQLDGILDTDYIRKYGREQFGIDRMIVAVAHTAQKHGLGLLVIDEIQHLIGLKQGLANSLNFFMSLMNEIRLPVVFVGTYRALNEVLVKSFTDQKRTFGIGTVHWENLKTSKTSDLDEYDDFIEDLWRYMWVKNEVPLTQEIKDCIYNKTAGIVGRIVKLFMAVQFEAVTSEKEVITPEMIEKVADRSFPLSQPAINALLSGDHKLLANFDDICYPDIEELYRKALDDVKTKKRIKEVMNSQARANNAKRMDIINEIAVFMANLEIPYEEGKRLATEIVKEHGIKKEMSYLKEKAVKKILSQRDSDISYDKSDCVDSNNKQSKTRSKGKSKSKEVSSEKFLEENAKEIFDGVKSMEA